MRWGLRLPCACIPFPPLPSFAHAWGDGWSALLRLARAFKERRVLAAAAIAQALVWCHQCGSLPPLFPKVELASAPLCRAKRKLSIPAQCVGLAYWKVHTIVESSAALLHSSISLRLRTVLTNGGQSPVTGIVIIMYRASRAHSLLLCLHLTARRYIQHRPQWSLLSPLDT